MKELLLKQGIASLKFAKKEGGLSSFSANLLISEGEEPDFKSHQFPLPVGNWILLSLSEASYFKYAVKL